MLTLTFLLTSFVIIATPSTGAVYTIAAGLSRGAAASVLAAFACTVAIVPHLLAAMTGLAAILHTSALAFHALKYLGPAYLLYMAWQMWRDKSALTPDTAGAAKQNAWQVIRTGVLINLFNPKLTLFFFAFLPQFIDAKQNEQTQMLLLSGVFMLMTFVVFALYGIFAATMRNYVLNRPKVLDWLRKSFAATFLALGAKLAISER